VVHRDLKPANVMINRRGEPVLIDFGLARWANPGDARLTRTGQPVGSLAYMSPEQVNGDVKAMGPACDIYGLGVLLYELLTGQLPFQGPMEVVMAKVLAAEPDAPTKLRPGLDPRLETVCRKAMAKRAADRYASMAKLAAALAPFLRGSTDTPAPPTHLSLNPGQVGAAPVPKPVVKRPSPVLPPIRPNSPAPADANKWRLAGKPAGSGTARSRRRWLAAGVAGLVALGVVLVAATVFKVKTKKGTLIVEINQPGAEVSLDGTRITVVNPQDKEPVRIEVDEGRHVLKVTKGGFETETHHFSLKQGDTESIRVRLEPRPESKPGPVPGKPADVNADRDRVATEWVIGQGGHVDLDTGGVEGIIRMNQLADLPPKPFWLVAVSLEGYWQITDAVLENLRGLPRLQHLNLIGTGIGNEGLQHLQGLMGLQELFLNRTKVSDEGLQHLRGLTGLRVLGLGGTNVSDAGLQHLRGMSRLQYLNLGSTKVSDTGLHQCLCRMGELQHLVLAWTQITNDGLSALKGLTQLLSLDLANNAVVSDKGLQHLQSLVGLQGLNLANTRVSDDGLEHLKKMTGLRWLSLDNTPIGDDGLKHLKGLTGLVELALIGTKVTDAGLEHLKGTTELAALSLSGKHISDKGLGYLKEVKGLKRLYLYEMSQLTDAGLEPLVGLELGSLVLAGTPISDAGLEYLLKMKGLQVLDLKGTKVSEEGFKRFHTAFPNCTLIKE